jgi:hypothetical protein
MESGKGSGMEFHSQPEVEWNGSEWNGTWHETCLKWDLWFNFLKKLSAGEPVYVRGFIFLGRPHVRRLYITGWIAVLHPFGCSDFFSLTILVRCLQVLFYPMLGNWFRF